jgi:glycosyltransferase involved in cell wall biosynthesis
MPKESCPRVAMLILPIAEPGTLFAKAQKDARTISEVASKVYLVSSSFPESMEFPSNCIKIDLKVWLHYVKHKSPRWFSIALWILKLIYIEIRMAIELIARNKELDVVICYLGYTYQVPIVVAKLMGKKVISGAWGIMSKEVDHNYGKLLAGVFKRIMDFSYSMSDVIIVRGWKVAAHESLVKWKNKMRLGASYFGDEELFKMTTPFDKRDDLIGFVGRLSAIKGIIKLIEAIPSVVEVHNQVKFVLIGTGVLDDEVREMIRVKGIENNVDQVGHVDNADLPEHYNKFKLFVIPSESEGLPNTLLEAISCHVPVLATPVGTIPEIIREGETGFVLKNNSPEEISRKIIELFENPDQLGQVIENAKRIINENYTFSAAVQRYQRIFGELCPK